MARIIVGGYSEPMVFQLFDRECRAMQRALHSHLLQGKGFFFRMGGDTEQGPIQRIVWISATSPITFEYDSELLPEVDDELVEIYEDGLLENGAVVFGSKAELDQIRAEMSAEA